MNDTRTPRSLRWRLLLIGAFVLATALLGLVPGLLPQLSQAHQRVLQGMALGAGGTLAVFLLLLAIPVVRNAYFQLLEVREQDIFRDKRILWLAGIALVLYLATLALAHWAMPTNASPALVIAIGLLPILAVTLYSASIVLHLRQLDELMRKIELESWALATLVVSQGYLVAWVVMQAGLVHIDASLALLSLGVWLLIVRTGFYVWLMRRYL
ncbi:hypothetical protein SAMN05428989_3516 [Pseudoxanthomonas sp. GM95]|uniref:hypothetical protein n=1 Tax=Pseudoxanthomonas sp. GM95 TaxID=1881043 RepID=UPI0008C89A88|nr:hypothetical protein [Pseudoxanthomonas sp. GM95]SEM25330.1 hypothetical protein SAMN05428989_3516 [Pseudoxanthomonas sp. GM95]